MPKKGNAKQQIEAQNSAIGQTYARTGSVTKTIQVTGTNYTKVHNTLVVGGLVSDEFEDD